MARSGAPLAHHVEGSNLRSDRGDSCRADNLSSRMYRWSAELGLSLCVATRLDLYTLCTIDFWLYRGSTSVARMATQSNSRSSARYSDNVWRRGRTNAY